MPAHLHLAAPPARSELRPTAGQRVRVVLAEAHVGVRRSLRQLLDGEQDLAVVGEAEDSAAVFRQVQAMRPRVLVFDLDMPGESGIHAIAELRRTARATQVVVTTMKDDPVFAQSVFAAGAIGYVAKDLADAELGEAIRAAGREEAYISPTVAGRLKALQRRSLARH